MWRSAPMLSSDALIVASLAAMLSSAAQTSMISMISFLVFRTMKTPRRNSAQEAFLLEQRHRLTDRRPADAERTAQLTFVETNFLLVAVDVRVHNRRFERGVRLVDDADVRVEGLQVELRRGLHVDFDWYTTYRMPFRWHKSNDPEDTMLETAASAADANAADAERKLTDGFHLVIEALTLNGVKTIYGVPGIPITDFGRLAQAAGIRVISFRHEQHAGNAAAIAGFLTKKPGICLTVSAPGFLNGLTALANATTNCFPMILISGSSEREIVDLQQGDYEEMDQLAIAKPLCKAAFRVLHAADIGIGVARAIRAAASGRPGGVYLDLPGKLFVQAIDAEAGGSHSSRSSTRRRRSFPRRPRRHACAQVLLKSAKRPLIILGIVPWFFQTTFAKWPCSISGSVYNLAVQWPALPPNKPQYCRPGRFLQVWCD